MIELERGPRKNPDFSRTIQGQLDWMYYPVDKAHFVEHQSNGQHTTMMSDGGKVQYKFHIVLDPSDYLTRTRKIVTNFLYENRIYHKSVGDKPRPGALKGDFVGAIANKSSSQYAKPFTLYCATLEQFYIVAKGMQEMTKKYSLQGMAPAVFDGLGSNMQYERAIPDTNNTLYYTVEKVDPVAGYNSIQKVPDAFGNTIKNWERQAKKDANTYGIEGNMIYEIHIPMSDKPRYFYRKTVMDHYMGEGPVDFLL